MLDCRRPRTLPAMSNDADTFQVTPEIAEMYEASFVPYLFGGLARSLVAAAKIGPGQRLLDVACGTGIVARTAAELIGPTGRVVGLDLNEAMLGVARRVSPELEWRQGDAAELPFGDGEFDVVTCQSGLMFVPDEAGAVTEMARVAAPGGTVAIQLWSAPERQPGFRPLADAVARHAGSESVNLISTYFRLGDPDAFGKVCAAAGLHVTEVNRLPVTLRAGSIDEYVTTEVESTPLVEQLSEDAYDKIRADAHAALAQYCDESGALAMPMEVYLLIARTWGATGLTRPGRW